VYGFVQEMPDFMHAADILLTKAGPGTISEAIASGLPVILYGRLDGPEDGNVRYLLDHQAGIWAPRADLVVAGVVRWLDHPEERARAATACLALARPQAARQIAGLILAQVNDHV
jgi:1,2-diacylglycerol 3-beta-galactosyltransferase